MDLPELIAALSRPQAFPATVGPVDVRQTHISVIFLAGEFAYKVKKPVRLSFLDFSTLERRRYFCEQEVLLNRRLAPDVYLGVVPIAVHQGQARFEGDREPVEWAVKMRRLPHEATLESRVARDATTAEQMETLAGRLAGFHARAERGPRIASCGRFEMVARNIRENFSVAAPLTGVTIHAAVRDRLLALTEDALSTHRELIEERAARGMPCDTHGDLHLDHVYLFPDRPPPGDLVIVDCIEFNERFRYADPVADMAFLAMDLQFQGRADLARAFVDAYFRSSGDTEGRRLLPLFQSYRAAVRGKVDGLQLAESEIPEEARAAARQRARGHWLLSLGTLERPSQRPCLLLVGGLPGTGKSTLARSLAARGGFRVVRSDVIRKELAGVSPETRRASELGHGLYTSDWTERTYAECLTRAEAALFAGERVLIDATFVEERRRRQFLDAAIRWGVPGLFLVCEAPAELVRTRIASRAGDASDANWHVYESAAARWEPPSTSTRHKMHLIGTEDAQAALQLAVRALREAGVLEW